MTTVLLVHGDHDLLGRLVPELSDIGVDVVGPARTAGAALMLAAQAPVDLALVGDDLAGRRSGDELRQALESNWGVPCRELRDADRVALRMALDAHA